MICVHGRPVFPKCVDDMEATILAAGHQLCSLKYIVMIFMAIY